MAFPIEQASATVRLPSVIPQGEIKLSGFTGPQGSRDSQLTASADNSAFQFVSTHPLAPHEGLTILLAWPKGFVNEPSLAEQLDFFFLDHRGALVLATGFLVLLLYYLVSWSAVGRDPVRGIIMPLYQPPQELSPAATRYLMRMRFDSKIFAAVILSMAAREFLTIKEQAVPTFFPSQARTIARFLRMKGRLQRGSSKATAKSSCVRKIMKPFWWPSNP